MAPPTGRSGRCRLRPDGRDPRARARAPEALPLAPAQLSPRLRRRLDGHVPLPVLKIEVLASFELVSCHP